MAVIAIVRVSVSFQQMFVLKKYLEAFLDAGGAENSKTFNLLKGIRDEMNTSLGKNRPHQDFGWPYKKAESVWMFLNTMLKDEVILAPADVTQACGLISALAIQLDTMSGIE